MTPGIEMRMGYFAKRSVMLAMGLCTCVAIAQTPQGTSRSIERERAASAKFELVINTPWQGDTVPYPAKRREGRLTGLAFSGNGHWLALNGTAFIDVATGNPAQAMKGALIGPAADDSFLLCESELFRGSADGNRIKIPYKTPEHLEAEGSLSGAHVLFHGSEYRPYSGNALLVDLDTFGEHPLPVKDRILTAFAWSPDESLIAIAFAYFCEEHKTIAEQIAIFDEEGKLVSRLRPEGQDAVTALAFGLDGKSVMWSDKMLHRVEVPSGRPLAWGELKQVWLGPIDEHLTLGHDGRQLTLFRSRDFMPVLHVDLGCGKGKELANDCALSPKRDLFAIATPNWLRVYRITP